MDIRITAMAVITTMMTMMAIITTTGRIVPTGQIAPTGRADQAINLEPDQGEAWDVPLECREVVVAVAAAAAAAVAVARCGLAQV
jgi:hypothetical protein